MPKRKPKISNESEWSVYFQCPSCREVYEKHVGDMVGGECPVCGKVDRAQKLVEIGIFLGHYMGVRCSEYRRR